MTSQGNIHHSNVTSQENIHHSNVMSQENIHHSNVTVILLCYKCIPRHFQSDDNVWIGATDVAHIHCALLTLLDALSCIPIAHTCAMCVCNVTRK